MQWDDITEKEKVRLLLEHVMGCFILKAEAKGWNTPSDGRGRDAPAGFHWPIAFWNTDCECWAMRDIATDPSFFDPLHDLSDAWKIIEHLDLPLDLHRYFTEGKERIAYYVAIGSGKDIKDASDRSLPKAICKAALRVVGIIDEQGVM